MDNEQKAENEEVVVDDLTESPAVEPETTPEATPQGEEPKEILEVTPSESEARPDVKPVEKRIHQLVDERDREKARAESLAQQVENLTSQFNEPQGHNPVQTQVEPGAEITPEQYRQDVAAQAQAITQMELQKERIINNVNKEATESMKAHPELDPSSQDFDKELSDTITDSVKAQIQVNPQASVRKLVDRLMKPYTRAVERKVAESTETITKQASESALRPSQIKVAETPFNNLSEKEMEAKLGSVW